LDFRESEELQMLRHTVSRIAAGYGHDYFLAKTRAGEKTTELWDELGAGGFIGVNLPESHGGGGMGLSALAAVCEEVAAAGCPLLLLVVSPAIAGTLLARFGTDAQKDRWLRGIAAGTLRFAFAITEPGAGSNSHRLTTTARRDGDGFRLSGTKYFISAVDEADAILVVARSWTDDATRRGALSLLVVPTDSPGLSKTLLPVEIVAPDKQFSVYFDDVWVPEENLLGAEGDGLRVLFYGLNPERVMGASVANGIGRYAIDRAAAYARDRRVWDVPIGAHQGVAHPLARVKIDVELARLANARAAWLYDEGLDAGEAANMAKYAAAEAAVAAVDQAVQVHGGLGLASETGVGTLLGLARLQRIAPVSREMVLNFVAQHSLGLPRSY
jgi:alkylation response protein AidB-like acyl-CoA dehydrogenase